MQKKGFNARIRKEQDRQHRERQEKIKEIREASNYKKVTDELEKSTSHLRILSDVMMKGRNRLWLGVILTASTLAMLYVVANGEIQSQEKINDKQERSIDDIRREVGDIKIKIAESQKTRSSPSLYGEFSAHCTCVARDNSKKHRIEICPAKNSTCDEESSRICESVMPNYEC